MKHEPVLLNEVIGFLDPKPGEFFIDGTVDGGGHAAEIFKRISPEGALLGVDWDKTMLEKARLNISAISKSEFLISKLILINDNYKNIPMILKSKKLGKADGLLLDLGFSSEQLEGSRRGFSFLRDEPLDMRYSDESRSASEWLNKLKETVLVGIIKDFGGERYAGRIAKAIKKNLPIITSKGLANIILSAVPKNYERGRIHPATRTFQALRIFVNQELENLKTVLSHIPDILNPGGRAAIISFHSLEDRLVKNYFRDFAKESRVELLTKKPITPSREEILNNPRSRSAKLRALKII